MSAPEWGQEAGQISCPPGPPPPPDTSYPPLEASEQPQDRPAGRGHLRTEALKGRSLR